MKAHFRGHLHLPFGLKEDVLFDERYWDAPPQVHAELMREARSKFDRYCSYNEKGTSGFYPVGVNHTWHNGIHLYAPVDTPVCSVGTGRIIAARLGDRPDAYALGSPYFVLIKHQFTLVEKPEIRQPTAWKSKDVQFYTLYMHLDGWRSSHGEVPWLEKYQPFLDAPNPSNGKLAQVKVKRLHYYKKPVQQNGRRGEQRTFQMTAGEPIGSLNEGDIVELCGGRAGEYQEINVPARKLQSVWISGDNHSLMDRPDFTEEVKALRNGSCMRLDCPIDAGELIGRVGVIKPSCDDPVLDTIGIHFELIAAGLPPQHDMPSDPLSFVGIGGDGWSLVADDTDDNAFCDSQEMLKRMKESNPTYKLIQATLWDPSRELDSSMVAFYYGNLSPADRESLRHTITYNTSYWSIDWKQLANENPAWLGDYACYVEAQEIANQYSWWRECENEKVDLPRRTDGKTLVYHYHPLAAMEEIHKHVPTPPVFFVQGTEDIVWRPADVGPGKRVMVYEPGVPDWLLGKRTGLGIENVDSDNLYQGLIKPGHEKDIPELSDSEKHIWASLWNNEGGFNAINTWDGSYLSFGPFQQTMGEKGTQGELQGALCHVKRSSPQCFDRHFGRYGLDVVGIKELWGGVLYGDVKIDGQVLTSDAEKQVLRDFIWAYRCVKAMRDPEFRLLFFQCGFNRLRVVKDQTARFGESQLQLGDVYKSELALALLLDLHINRPATLGHVWTAVATTVLGRTFNPATITSEQEYAMIRQIKRERAASSLTDANKRTAEIVLCTRGLKGDDGNKIAQKLGYKDREEIFQHVCANVNPKEHGSCMTIAESRMYDFLGHERDA